ncbi:hypothetical protein GIB67_015251 [Kingdonia uniflora]|uniref:non-specific serine/threonine protein kinase n=1 Tax=Kingdonia uniflora TaxID=39325 RepID=A0A7J7MSQ3_9MAGN|nr:hypothetical protein GIB67_015251 [Kingdonia uniflora]
MKHGGKCFFSVLLLPLLLMLPVISISLKQSMKQSTEILLRTQRAQLEDPKTHLRDWIPSKHSPCDWVGITCDYQTHEVISIDLSEFELSGTFPSSFCQIPTLQNLTLADNYFHGGISSNDMTPCFKLRHLNISDNLFDGVLPEFEPQFGNLRLLDFSQNNFSGEIPRSFGRFPKLQVLRLFSNGLNGTIPGFLGDLSELVAFEIAYNPFAPGSLPVELGNMTKLENFWLPVSNLVGVIPESFGNLVALRNLDLSDNDLEGRIPDSIGGLRSVEQIELYNNWLSGELPESLGKLSNLRNFDASQNNLTGKLPESFLGLQLVSLGLNDNNLEGEVPEIIASNTRLVQLKLFKNKFSGSLPKDLGRNSDLEDFDVSGNRFVGELPSFLCYRKKLSKANVFNNRFSGNVSAALGDCSSLTYVRIFNNELEGEIPVGLWSLSNLTLFELRNNRFQGAIPSTISNARSLTQLLISNNQFSGKLPLEICGLVDLSVADLSRNQLSGELPACMTGMKKLAKLDLQENKFSGRIPSKVSSWRDLTELNLSVNRFVGEIPNELGRLPVLNYLDLSENLLSGKIPTELANLKLNKFNLSGNNLAGRIPSGFDNNIYLSSLVGNPNLCSPDLKPFTPCPKTKTTSWFLIVVILGLIALLVLSFFWFCKSKTKTIGRKVKLSWKLTSFHRVSFNEEEIFASLTDDNLIGVGGSGKVYRAKLKTGQTVAVKKLWGISVKPEAERVFQSEVGTLGSIRHINIVKLLFSCAGDDFRVLVYEYMENGSLGDLLHGEKGGVLLDWRKRFTVAIGAAQGLAYLHHDCTPPIVHRDVKSNNILLDEEFCPCVSDFGLAKTLRREGGEGDNIMSCVAGSYGYIAPEYAYTSKVTEKSDVYSFGVVLMELVTGKRPIDSSFGENKDIVKWVADAAVATQENGDGDRSSSLRHLMDTRMKPSSADYEEMEKILNLALLCTSAFPLNRPSMRRVVELLKDQSAVSFSSMPLSK